HLIELKRVRRIALRLDPLLSEQVLSQTEVPTYQMQSSSYQILTAVHRTGLASILGPFGPRARFFNMKSEA
ncbi:MAG: hypothetical protein DMG50_08535, partial [Acidobacteria bacterium]